MMKPPATVRGRLLLLMSLAAVPVIGMAGFIAWQNYRSTAVQADARVYVAQEAALGRYEAAIEGTARALTRLADRDALGGGLERCDRELRRLQSSFRETIVALAYEDASPALRCDSRSGLAPRRAAAAASPQASITRDAPVAVAPGSDAGSSVLRVRLPLEGDGAASGVLVAELDVGSLIRPAVTRPALGRHAWLTDTHGQVLASAIAGDPAWPSAGTLAQTASRPEPVVADARSGELFDYIGSPLAPGVRLVIATPAGTDVDLARRILGRRIVELGVLVLAGLGLIAVGANLAIVEPLNRLTRSVRAWRKGGTFDANALQGPTELTELANSFGEAVAAVAERERLLNKATEQQELLMQEIHHRVKNNLQIIASLLNLQASRIRLPEARAEFQSARDRIRALATLHRHLYAYGELHTINMRSFLTELCGQLLQAIGEAPQGPRAGRIRLDIEAVELKISSDQAVPMALIVTEAVSNAAKYAFPGGRRGAINIRLTAEDEIARLVIEDDGVGIPAGRAETETGVRDGIGIQLIRGFARQLGAELVVTEEHGTRYALTIPLRRAAAAEGGGVAAS